MCLVYSRQYNYLVNWNKAWARLYGGAPDSFQTENSFIIGVEPEISHNRISSLNQWAMGALNSELILWGSNIKKKYYKKFLSCLLLDLVENKLLI